MKKGQILEKLHVDQLGYGGVGVSTLETGKKVLIKGALPGSTVDVRVIKIKKDYIQGHISKVHDIPTEYIQGKVRCPHYLFPYHQQNETIPPHKSGCGGCKWQVVSYEQQLVLKQQIVEDCYAQLVNTYGPLPFEPILAAPEIFHYRNKIEFSFGKYLQRAPVEEREEKEFSIAEHWNLGLHKQGEFSKVIDIDQCFLASQKMHKVYAHLKQLCEGSGLPVHDAKTHQGFFRHLLIREGVATGQIMVLLSVAPKYLSEAKGASDKRKSFVRQLKHDTLLQEFVTTCIVNETNALADAIRTEDAHQEILRGPGVIFETLEIGGVASTFQISPFSFFQTNTRGAELLFSTAMNLLTVQPDTIIDLYCGSGSIGLSFLHAGLGKRVVGVDIVASAIADAHKNAKINQIEQATFYAGKAEQVVFEIFDADPIQPGDLVIVDPPREGMHPKTIDFLLQLAEKYRFQLLYISCNPKTMARDIEKLLPTYELQVIQAVDMFPHTQHIETIAVLTRG